ncbi:MAG: hypothetical protein EPN85_07140 [Bacteroidetes bacterium]|nr:MAG: hypothetical protein EPN85_07140 [Bacteroidota bacterium]
MNRLNTEGHIVEEINGTRCSIVEKNVSPERVEFLKKLLEHNGYIVITAPTPPPSVKQVPKPIVPSQATLPTSGSPEGGGITSAPVPPSEDVGAVLSPAPHTFTVGITNITFHTMLAVYERSLYTPEGKPVSIAYWNQEKETPEQLYWERRVK